LGTRSSVTLYKGHLGIGVAEPSGQLELAGDERIQEYPPRALTGYETLVEGHGVFCAYPSSPRPLIGAMTQLEAIQYNTNVAGTWSGYENLRLFWRNNDGLTMVLYYGSNDLTNFTVANYHGYTPSDLGLFPGATEVWVRRTASSAYQATGIKDPSNYAANILGSFNKNDALTDYWESGASTYTSTSGGSPAVSTSGSERLASNTPYGPWVTLKLPYEICLKRYEFTGAGTKSPKEGQIWGTTDGTTWSHVHTFTGGVTDVKNNETVSGNTNYYSEYAFITTKITGADTVVRIVEIRYFGTPGPTTLDKGSLTLGRSLDVPRISRYDVDTETPRPEKLVVDFDTTVNSSPTDISGQGNHGTFGGSASYSAADKAFNLANNPANVTSAATHFIQAELNNTETGNQYHSVSLWFKVLSGQNSSWRAIFESSENPRSGNGSISLYVPGNPIQDKLAWGMGTSTMYSETIPNLFQRWHHIALTYDGVNRKMYLNGELIQTLATTSWSGVANMTLSLGKNNHSNASEGCDCHISNFKLYWQTALEASEVRKLYNLGRTGRSMVISDTAVGIGKVPEAQLDVRGVLKCDKLFVGDEVIEVMSSPVTIAFSTYWSPNQGDQSTTGTYTPNQTYYNYGNGFDTSNGRFTAPINGIYHIEWNSYTNNGYPTTNTRIVLYKNGTAFIQRGSNMLRHAQSLSATLYLAANEYIHIGGDGSYPLYYYTNTGKMAHYSGYLVSAT
jgi:hypothetical protein